MAVIVAVVVELTAVVVTVKVAVVLPAGTVTLAGTIAEAPMADNATGIPPAGAAALKVTVPVEDVPAATVVGLSDSAVRATPAVMLRLAVLLTPL